jgi:hypothetical protein
MLLRRVMPGFRATTGVGFGAWRGTGIERGRDPVAPCARPDGVFASRFGRRLRISYPARVGYVTQRPDEGAMSNLLSNYAVPAVVAVVAIVLLLGLGNMLRGGSPNTSQRLMRLRVLLQFVAVVVIMLTIWAMGR